MRIRSAALAVLAVACLGASAAAQAQYHHRGDWRPGPDWNRQFVVHCSSEGYGYNFCSVDLGRRGRVMIQRQQSNSPCVRGRSWGYNRAGIWVDQGCEADFRVSRRW